MFQVITFLTIVSTSRASFTVELFNVIAGVASIIGLIVSLYTLYAVTNLPAALKQQSRDKHFSTVIDKVLRIPDSKTVLPDSTVREVEALLQVIRIYDVSKIPFVQRKFKQILKTLEQELADKKRLEVVRIQLGFIRDEITIR